MKNTNPKDRGLTKKASKAFKIPTYKNPNKLILTLMPWRENAPMALPIGGWEKRREELRKKFPIRHFLFEDLPYIVDVKSHHWVINPLNNVKWFFIHRFHPKHQYHILKPRSLKPGYYDSDERILHACMDELSMFVEWNKKHQWVNWNGTKEHKHAWKEMNAIYKWWNRDRPASEKKQDELLTEWHDRFLKEGGLGSETLSAKTNKLHDKLNVEENRMHNTDEEMLARLMRIRRFMWT